MCMNLNVGAPAACASCWCLGMSQLHTTLHTTPSIIHLYCPQGMGQLAWHVADMLELPFDSASFDAVVEKGTMDVLFVDNDSPWSPRPEVCARVERMLDETHRCRPLNRVFPFSLLPVTAVLFVSSPVAICLTSCTNDPLSECCQIGQQCTRCCVLGACIAPIALLAVNQGLTLLSVIVAQGPEG